MKFKWEGYKMKFIEIKKELEQKRDIISNSIDHIKFNLERLQNDLVTLTQDYDLVDNMLTDIESISTKAE